MYFNTSFGVFQPKAEIFYYHVFLNNVPDEPAFSFAPAGFRVLGPGRFPGAWPTAAAAHPHGRAAAVNKKGDTRNAPCLTNFSDYFILYQL